jgi:mono/diheme cytochrome c family protein
MSKPKLAFLILVVTIGIVAALALRSMIRHGFSARDTPSAPEAFLARRMRRWAIPENARKMKNPFSDSAEAVEAGRMHFADHCASCHGNDGRGKTEIGQNLYPRAPDMWDKKTQTLSDGEIFSIIKNGVRLTGMPAWGQDTPEDDRSTWHLVSFIRHLPWISEKELEEMKDMNPKTPEEFREDEEVRRFLEGGEAVSTTQPMKKMTHSH